MNNKEPVEITKDFLDSLDPHDKFIALQNYHRHIKEARKLDKQNLVNLKKRIYNFKNRDKMREYWRKQSRKRSSKE